MSEVVQAAAVAVLLASGIATRYDEGVMEPVVANRVEWGDIDLSVPHKGFVALLDRGHLGRQVWLQHGERIDGPYLVADCASGKDRDRLVRLDWAVDLSWDVAQEWNVVDDVVPGFLVWDADPRALPVVPGCPQPM